MANRDHSLDDRIICAARAEFLSCGFRKASLRKIADNAGVTTGAIYTRYRNKDTLFSSLMSSQFWYFRQLLDAHLAEDDMAACLKVILDFTNAGWRQFCNDLS